MQDSEEGMDRARGEEKGEIGEEEEKRGRKEKEKSKRRNGGEGKRN